MKTILLRSMSLLSLLAPYGRSVCAQVELVLDQGFRSDVTVPLGDLSRASLEYPMLYGELAVTMDFSASVTNLGAIPATDVFVILSVVHSTGTAGPFVSAVLPMLAAGDSDTLSINAAFDGSWAEQELALHFSVSSLESDIDPSNNSDTTLMWVTYSQYTSRTQGVTTGALANSGAPYMIGNRYEITEEIIPPVCALSCVVPYDPALIGSFITGYLFDESWNELSEGSEVLLTASNMSEPGETNRITLPLLSEVYLQTHHDYYAMVADWVGSEGIAIATEGSSPDSSSWLIDIGSMTWFSIAQTPMVDIGIGYMGICYSAIGEHQDDLQVVSPPFPAPCASAVMIPVRLMGSTSIQWVIVDPLGRIVMGPRSIHEAFGDQIIQIDINELSSGTYFCILRANDVTQQLQLLVGR